jgi:signal peptidase I
MSDWKSEAIEYLKSFAIAIALALVIITFVAQSFVVQGVSMEPTFRHGDRLMVDKISYRLHEPERGDIVVFRYPANPRQRFIKRVIALPGDTIEVRQNQVYLNDQLLQEDYIKDKTYGEFGPVVVPDQSVFVMGDNRNNSEDSRFSDVGPVPRRLVVGKALFQYWPLTTLRLVPTARVYPESRPAPSEGGSK